MNHLLQKWKWPLFILLIVFALVGCSDMTEEGKAGKKENNQNYPEDVSENPIATITMENDQQISIELYPEIAPNTVANFISLANDTFYDGLTFHRIIPDFMIQGGDPQGNGTGGPGYSIEGEFSSNDFTNDLKHERGIISMARSNAPNSAGSQFFIMVADAPHLDGDYAAFGKVIDGMDAVDKIVEMSIDAAESPTMKSVTIDTMGYDYPSPERVE
ncbi:peptidylprolyl isomerase [Virgibacillus salexigens]|uniref:Peptidyl-prolyl cis-trans isomerase n=1 Tax=Virgibacillus massiliensis TaxID=1462526 RepID=A0A024QHI8_9BACI|nr:MULTISPECIES: peptidylprolyl isomerase [Virgibacillus]CDQ41983.1 putative peptidyl-prolyl cis-trans isomerase [Virgibacillus massiliensis]